MEEEIVFCKYNQAEEEDYVWAGCLCSLRPDWGHRIKRTSLDRFVEFRCPQCQSQISMFVLAKNNKTHYLIS